MRQPGSRPSRVGKAICLALLGVLTGVIGLDPAHPGCPAGAAAAAGETIEARLWGTVRSVPTGTHLVIMTPEMTPLQVRLLGVELPDPPRTVPAALPGQPFGPEAAAYVRELLTGKQVRFDSYGADRAGCILAVVWLGEINVNLTLIKEGLAWVDPSVTNGFVRAPLEVAERQARVAKYGLWALPNPEAPWAYRKRHNLPAE